MPASLRSTPIPALLAAASLAGPVGAEPRAAPPGVVIDTPVQAMAREQHRLAELRMGRRYSIGNPTAKEQLLLELLNRARANSRREATRLSRTRNQNIRDAIAFFDVDMAVVRRQFRTLRRQVPPLAFNRKLVKAARLHSKDMNRGNFQAHESSSRPFRPNRAGDSIGDRVRRQRYRFQSVAENVFAYGLDLEHVHAGMEIDWGNGPNGIQNPPGHRITNHNRRYREVGIGLSRGRGNGNGARTGPLIVTYDFGLELEPETYITGVVYRDKNRNRFYDVGEGLRNVRVRVAGIRHFSLTGRSGGYAIPVTRGGRYRVTFTSNRIKNRTKRVRVHKGRNRKVDYRIRP